MAMPGCCCGLGLAAGGGKHRRGPRVVCKRVRAVAVAANEPML